MTFAKGIALALAFVGAVALGVLIAPHIIDRDATVNDTTASANQTATSAEKSERTARRAPAARSSAKSMTKPATKAEAEAAKVPGATPLTVPAAAPALHERLKPILNKGADMGKASQDFADGEQFAAVAHAARNTEVPFMVLKHRVVVEGKSLEKAIEEVKPDLNGAAEARLARAQAKSDISDLKG
jgi:hypothetical protein